MMTVSAAVRFRPNPPGRREEVRRGEKRGIRNVSRKLEAANGVGTKDRRKGRDEK